MNSNIDSQSKTSDVNKPFFYSIRAYFKKLFKAKNHSFEESVSELINEHKEDSSVHTEEKMILQNIITFGDRFVSDVMVPRTEITTASEFIDLDKLKKLFIENGHSRIPIHRNNVDQIIGFVHIKDLFKILATKSKLNISEICRDIIFVPRSMKVTDMLSNMKQAATHMAIVLDEHGGTDGLVTIEDIVEEVVGEIYDEYDETNAEFGIEVLEKGVLLADAKAKIECIFENLEVQLSESDPKYDTIGGFITSFVQRIPLVGEKIAHPLGFIIEIIDADERKIKKIKLYSK